MFTPNFCFLLVLNIGLLHAAPMNRRFCVSIMRMDCSRGFSPNIICGDDGVTYPNDCIFSKAMCKNKNLNELHKGACVVPTTEAPTTTEEPTTPEPTTEEPTTEAGSVEDQLCKTILERDCTSFKKELICGTDGITYQNDCLFSKALCRDMDLDEQNKGPCIITTEEPTTIEPTTEEPTTTMAPTTEEPTTTMVPTTEEPTTTMKPTTMEPTTEEPTTTMAPTTEEPTTTMEPTTEEPTTPETITQVTTFPVTEATKKNEARCCKVIMKIDCAGFENDFICGSDGVTYPNECEFAKASCQETTLKELPKDACVGITEAPPTTEMPSTEEPKTSVDASLEVTTEEITIVNVTTEIYRTTGGEPSELTTTGQRLSTLDFKPIIKDFFCTWTWEEELECDPSSKDYTCASDNRTYRTRCDMAKAHCDYPNLHVVKEGICPGDMYAVEYKHHSYISHFIIP